MVVAATLPVALQGCVRDLGAGGEKPNPGAALDWSRGPMSGQDEERGHEGTYRADGLLKVRAVASQF